MNWSIIILGLVALSSLASAENSYLIAAPKLLKVDHENQMSVFIATASQPVDVKFELVMGRQRTEAKTTCKSGETRNAVLTLPKEFPIGPGELIVTGTGGLTFEEKRAVIVYDNRHVILVQTSASTYRPTDTMEMRVVTTDENLIPVEQGELTIEIYDSGLNLVGEFRNVPIRSGLTETIRYPIAKHCNSGTWLISATMGNTTSSVEVLVSYPVTPSFDLKAIFQRYLLRTDKALRGVIEMNDDNNKPIFGRATISIGQITEQKPESMMNRKPEEDKIKDDEWRQWKTQHIEIAGRVELNYDLASLFNIDMTKALAINVHIEAVDLTSGHERAIRHVIPIFTHDVIYDIRPLEFEAGIQNEFQIVAKRPDGKPTKMEDMIVTVSMIMSDKEGKKPVEKVVEINDFYTRGRNDIGIFNIEIPEDCIGVLMTITPLSEDGKVRGYRTRDLPLMPRPPRHNANTARLSIELLPSTVAPTNTDVTVPVISSQISTVGRTSNFYVQLIPSKTVEKFERLPMSYILMTNGRITLTGEFYIEPTKECQTKAPRAIRPEEPRPPTCLFNGTLPIQITRDMVPYSTLLVYTFQPSFGFHVAESYRFSVAGLFQSSLTLNATIVPFTPTETVIGDNYMMKQMNVTPIHISDKVQDKTRVELSFAGAANSLVGLHVVEFDAVTQGLSNDMTKERLLKHLTMYEQVPITGMPAPIQPGMKEAVKDKKGSKRGAEWADAMPFEKRGAEWADAFEKRGVEWADAMPVEKRGAEWADAFEKRGAEWSDAMPVEKRGAEWADAFEKRGAEWADALPQFERRTISEKGEEELMNQERMAAQIRYPFEQTIYGYSSARPLPTVEGDDVYRASNMERLYNGEESSSRPSSRRKLERSMNQNEVAVDGNDQVVVTSMPMILASVPRSPSMPPMPLKPEEEQDDDVDMMPPEEAMHESSSEYGTPSWYAKMHSKLNAITPEAFTFMFSGLTVISDFDSLHVPTDMKRLNFTKLFTKFRTQSNTMFNYPPFSIRDEARELLEDYINQSDLSMVPPLIMVEEQARTGYHQSVFFNTSRIESQGTGKVVLPRTKPYSTWLATGFALNTKSGLSIAQPIRLPTNQGLYVLGNCPKQVRMNEHVLLTYGINNYLGKDLTNVVFRIRASPDFDLYEEGKLERMLSSKDKDYTVTIPSLKTLDVEKRNIMFVPKRSGIIQIVMEVESEFGGDYEILTVHVHETGIEREEFTFRLFDLTNDKKPTPMVEKFTESSNVRSVRVEISGTNLEDLIERHPLYQMRTITSALVGIDRALVRLYRSLSLRRYLNETLQTDSPVYNMTADNITTAYQTLQLYSDYDGSFSFISDEGMKHSSLYLTSLSFGAMISPMMPFRDNVTLNRTLTWILSRQQEDGSFDDVGPCFHYRFCTGEFRRESLTALVLYALTRDNALDYMPEFVRYRLHNGENNPIMRAQRYLESRVSAVKSDLLTITLFEMAFIQNRAISSDLRKKIHETLVSRKLAVIPEDGTKYLQDTDKMTHADQILINSMTTSLYLSYNDYRTASDISRWIVSQISNHSYYESILDAVFQTAAWVDVDIAFRRQFGAEKMAITVELSTDNGQKQQVQVDSKNMDMTQILHFTLPVREITCSVSGFGMLAIRFIRKFVEEQTQQPMEPIGIQLSQKFVPMPWYSEINATTCITYKPTTKDQQSAKDTFNRTMVVEVELPSGMRVNLRQIGFFLSRMENVMYFTHEPCGNKLAFFINVPSMYYGKEMCLEWCLERLSTVMNWSPIRVRAYDYLQQGNRLVQMFPIDFQPKLLGYSFIDAVHKARPSIETVINTQTPPIA